MAEEQGCENCRYEHYSDRYCNEELQCEHGSAWEETDEAVLRRENESLMAERDRMREMLKKLEWSMIVGRSNDKHCPVCGAWNKNGHTPDCALAALLIKGE